MQKISSYDARHNAALQPALRDFENPDRGLEARYLLTSTGWFARFVWPDWPKELAEKLSIEVQEFHRQHPQLRPIAEGDSESAEVIAKCFGKHFQNALCWVKSVRDPRGRIGATCQIKGVGVFFLDLSWRASLVQPVGILDQQYWSAFQLGVREISHWASHRIQSVLEGLKQ